MSRKKAGLKKEHEIAKEIYRATGGKVIPLRAGWSGNSSPPLPDLLIPLDGSLRALEIKTCSQKRLVVSQDDVSDIVSWALDMSELAVYPYITVKFTHYEAQTERIYKPWDIEQSFEIIADNTSLNSRVTSSGNISFGHPTHYSCDTSSAVKSPGDGPAIIRDLYEDNPTDEKEEIGVHTILESGPDSWSYDY
jgi:Holliday junction resolvase - archaeal type